MSDTRGRAAAPSLDLRSTAAAQTRSAPTLLDQVIANSAGGFDAEAYRVMSERDNAMIAQELLNGAGSSKFVYSFENKGERVAGVSVIGARHLATQYGDIRHRIIGSIEKRGALFVFISYEGGMRVETKTLHDLADETDYYTVLIEMEDVKTGNRLQLEKSENRVEKRRDGSTYERAHYKTIAQSKAYRNGVLALVPQDVRIRWEQQQLGLAKGDVITGSVIEEKRSGILRYAAGKGLAVDRHQIEALTLDQIAGLADAAREKNDGAFGKAARALGLLEAESVDQETGEITKAPATAAPAKAPEAKPARQPRQPRAEQSQQQQQPSDPAHQAEPQEGDDPYDTLRGQQPPDDGGAGDDAQGGWA